LNGFFVGGIAAVWLAWLLDKWPTLAWIAEIIKGWYDGRNDTATAYNRPPEEVVALPRSISRVYRYVHYMFRIATRFS
jgi:hypothetical protein